MPRWGSGSGSSLLGVRCGAKYSATWSAEPAIEGQGQLNRLRVETEGDRIRLYVNDKLLDEVSDDTFTEGSNALAVNTFDEGDAAFLFDNLVVRGQ